jgi:competence protein ComEC
MFLISPHLNFNYNIYYLDVGQGDSTIITTPFLREVYIIDTGGIYYKKESYEISRYKTIPLLKSLGVRKVTSLILTHGDFDHLGEAEYLLNHYNIKSLILNCNNRNEIENDLFFSYYKRVKDPANLRKLELLSCRTFDDENDSSLSFKLNAFHSTLYFGGDLPNWYQDRYTFKIDFLKLSHHGSKTSTSEHFIENTKPIYAIASLKKNNMYGHPHQKVVEILKKYNVKLYRTDQDGTIHLRISPFEYQIKTFPPN